MTELHLLVTLAQGMKWMVRPVIHSTKHYVQQSIGTVTAGSSENTELVIAVAVSDKNLVNEVEEGATIKAVYFELWIRSAATAAASFVFCFMKKPSGILNPTVAELAALGDYDNKKNILYTTQGLTNDVDADALNLYKGWIRIPKGKQRMGLNDRISWHLSAIGQSINFCGFATYKEYTWPVSIFFVPCGQKLDTHIMCGNLDSHEVSSDSKQIYVTNPLEGND